eukprot:COSAG04_NODE_22_length_37957_cov_250.276930_17_plen_1738_part_00
MSLPQLVVETPESRVQQRLGRVLRQPRRSRSGMPREEDPRVLKKGWAPGENEVFHAFLSALGTLSEVGLSFLRGLCETACVELIADLLARHSLEREAATEEERKHRGALMRDADAKPPGYREGDLCRAAGANHEEGANHAKTTALLAAGVNPNAAAELLGDWPPLHFAAKGGHTEVVVELLKYSADPFVRDREGETALIHARYWGQQAAAAALDAAEIRAIEQDESIGEKSALGALGALLPRGVLLPPDMAATLELPHRVPVEEGRFVQVNGRWGEVMQLHDDAVGLRWLNGAEPLVMTDDVVLPRSSARANEFQDDDGRWIDDGELGLCVATRDEVAHAEQLAQDLAQGKVLLLPHQHEIEHGLCDGIPCYDASADSRYRVTVLCSAPEFSRNGDEVMVGLFLMCELYGDFIKFGYDWAGSTNAAPSDVDPTRRVPACCHSVACTCAERSSEWVVGPVDWSNPLSVAGSMWFPKYRAKVIGAIQAEAQRPGVKLVEIMLLHGGPVTQLEQRTMPHVVCNAVIDLRKKGISIGFPGQGADITIFMRCVEYTEFFDRFLGELGVSMVADSTCVALDLVGKLADPRNQRALGWWLTTSAAASLTQLDISQNNIDVKAAEAIASSISALRLLVIGPKNSRIPVRDPAVSELCLEDDCIGPAELIMLSAAFRTLDALTSLNISRNFTFGTKPELKRQGKIDKPTGLVVHDVDRDQSGWQALCDGIKNSQLACLIVADIGMGKVGAAKLASSLSATLTSLSVAGNPLKVKGIRVLCDGLCSSGSKLQSLNVANCILGSKSMTHVAKYLAAPAGAELKSITLDENDLTGTKIQDKGKFERIKKLDANLSGFEAFCSALCSSQVASLSMGRCHLGLQGVTVLVGALKTAAVAISLNVDSNAIFGRLGNLGQRGEVDKYAAQCEPFCDALKASRISALSVSNTGMGPIACVRVASSLPTELNSLNVGLKNEIGLDGGAALQTALETSNIKSIGIGKKCTAATGEHITMSSMQPGVSLACRGRAGELVYTPSNGEVQLKWADDGTKSGRTDLEVLDGVPLNLPLQTQFVDDVLDLSLQQLDIGLISVLAWWLSTPSAVLTSLTLSNNLITGSRDEQLGEEEYDLDLSGITALGETIATSQALLASIDFSGCMIAVAGVTELSNFIPSTALTSLNLSKNPITGTVFDNDDVDYTYDADVSGLTSLGGAMVALQKLTRLDLSDCKMAVAGATELARWTSAMAGLTSLSLSHNFIFGVRCVGENPEEDEDLYDYVHDVDKDQSSWSALCDGLKGSRLATLIVADIGMGPVGCAKLSTLFDGVLSEVDISQNQIGVCGAQALANGIRGSSLHVIVFGPKSTRVPLNDPAATELNFEGQGFGPVEVIVLAAAISTNKEFTSLTISQNFVFGSKRKATGKAVHDVDGDQCGWNALCDYMKDSQLTSFIAADVGMGPIGCGKLAASVNKAVLTSLTVDSNDAFGARDGRDDRCCWDTDSFADQSEPFFASLSDSQIEALSLKSTGMGPIVCGMLARSLPAALTDLTLDDNPGILGGVDGYGVYEPDEHTDGFQVLVDAMKTSSITKLSLSDIGMGVNGCGIVCALLHSTTQLSSLTVDSTGYVRNEKKYTLTAGEETINLRGKHIGTRGHPYRSADLKLLSAWLVSPAGASVTEVDISKDKIGMVEAKAVLDGIPGSLRSVIIGERSARVSVNDSLDQSKSVSKKKGGTKARRKDRRRTASAAEKKTGSRAGA